MITPRPLSRPSPAPPRAALDVSPMSDEEWEALTGEKTSDANAPQFQDAPATGGDPVLPFD